MKAILVIDHASEEDIGEKTSIHLINKKNKWYEEVVIKPMPERKPTDFLNYWFNQGYNALHDELVGDEDER